MLAQQCMVDVCDIAKLRSRFNALWQMESPQYVVGQVHSLSMNLSFFLHTFRPCLPATDFLALCAWFGLCFSQAKFFLRTTRAGHHPGAIPRRGRIVRLEGSEG